MKNDLTFLNKVKELEYSILLQEKELLKQLVEDFPMSDWIRLKHLDWKMEANCLTKKEAKKLLKLATAYENYTVKRLQLLTKLAILRNISLDELMAHLRIRA